MSPKATTPATTGSLESLPLNYLAGLVLELKERRQLDASPLPLSESALEALAAASVPNLSDQELVQHLNTEPEVYGWTRLSKGARTRGEVQAAALRRRDPNLVNVADRPVRP